jgi:glycosyltransferase involved in cell wall biosynthesis
MTNLAIVIPCFNEEAVLRETAKQVGALLCDLIAKKKVSEKSFIYFVDDGSRDDTWNIITQLNSGNPIYKGHRLAKNAGHQRALLSGLLTARDKADVVISLDADLQDDISIIPEFIAKYHEGYQVIYGVRKERNVDTIFKKSSALGFYWVMSKLGVDLVRNHADYRLLSKSALNALSEFRESNLFLRGIIPLLGFKTTSVYYDRQARFAGESKYPLKKMLAFAFEGITSFSVSPLRFITGLGFFIFIGSLLLSAWTFVSWLRGKVIPGWTSTVLPIYLISGVQIASIGIIGEYLGKVYLEVKRRPLFIVEQSLS